MWQQTIDSLISSRLTVWVVPLAGLAVTLGVLLLGRRLGGRPVDPAPGTDPGVVEGAIPAPPRQAERRANPRRKGAPKEVTLSHPDGLPAPDIALVLDRSTGGLCLGVSSPVPVGTMLRVSTPTSATGCRMSVTVEVRSCAPDEEGWRLGCSFSQRISYNELILFG